MTCSLKCWSYSLSMNNCLSLWLYIEFYPLNFKLNCTVIDFILQLLKFYFNAYHKCEGVTNSCGKRMSGWLGSWVINVSVFASVSSRGVWGESTQFLTVRLHQVQGTDGCLCHLRASNEWKNVLRVLQKWTIYDVGVASDGFTHYATHGSGNAIF